MLGLVEDSRTDVGAQGLAGEKLHAPAEDLLEQDWDRWDRRIERDAAEGRLEPLFERALEAHRQGKSREV
jgi:hypothetical protein